MIFFLAGRIPNLHSDDHVIDHDFLLLEISSDGRLGHRRRLALRVPQQQRCLTDVGVAKHNDLQEIFLLR